MDTQRSFTILQWNVLADHLCTNDSFPKINQEALTWAHRQKLFQEEFEAFKHVDVVCFEEVDHQEFFTQLLGDKYAYNFQPKKGAPDGIYFAYNREKFQAITTEFINYVDEQNNPMTQFYVKAVLQAKDGFQLNIIGTHLKAKKQFDNVRVQQLKQLLEEVKSLAGKPLIVLGDFNAEPTYESIQLFSGQSGLYNINNENKITTFKIREHVECRTIDYVFYSQELTLLTHNIAHQDKQLPDLGFPNEKYPSDHLYLMATFKY